MTVLVLATACSHPDSPSLDTRIRQSIQAEARLARDEGHDELANVLRDGVLTDAEIDRMHSLYRECMAKTRAKLLPAVKNPIDNRTWIDPLANQPDLTGADNQPTFDCMVRFDVSNAAMERPRPMPEPLRRYLAECLHRAGYSTDPKDRDIRQIYGRAGRDSIPKVADCVTDGVLKLYPETGGVGFGPPNVY